MLAKLSAQVSHGTCSIDREKKVTGEAYRLLSADFSAHQQGPSAILQIAGNPSGKRLGQEGFWEDPGSLWAGPPFPLVPAEEGEEGR